jgi:hypothetical protein
MTKSTPSPTVPPKRNSVIVAIDIIAGLFLVLVGLTFGLYVVTYASQYPQLVAACGEGPFSGLECNANWVSTWSIIIIGVAVFSFALSTGMVIVNLVRKRPVWFWPLIGVILTIVAFYAGTALVGLAVPNFGATQ